MPSTSQITKNLESLDYAESGFGMVERHLKELVSDEAYLFIGIGGKGTMILSDLKKKMKKTIERDELEKVAYLAIDTDKAVENEMLGFETAEIFEYNSGDAVFNSTTPESCPPEIKEWINPMHSSTVRREAAYSGMGAGAVRQVSRVHLFYPTNYGILQDKLMNAARRATVGGAHKLNVYFFAGIAGGTGSGSIIDIGILTRDILTKGFPPLNGSIYYRAYVLLPGACGFTTNPVDIQKGNENAFAALKELDYFMTIMDGDGRDNPYVIDYGVSKVTLENNIFDFCTLIDNTSNVVESPEKVASSTVVNTIMNSIISNHGYVDAAGNPGFMLDSFMSNVEKVNGLIGNKPQDIWPKEANYIYTIIGYSECIIPVGLINAYIMRRLYTNVHDVYWNHALEIDPDNPTDANLAVIDEFMEKCGLDVKTMLSSDSNQLSQGARDQVANMVDQYARYHGPWYMINVTNLANRRIESYYASEVNGKLLTSQNKKNAAISKYNQVHSYFSDLNHNLFEVYKTVLEKFGEVLEKDAGILTDAQTHHDVFGSSFTWSLVDFTDKGSPQYELIKGYLDDMFNQEKINSLTGDFVNYLMDKREEWTGYGSDNQGGNNKFSPDKAILEFIKSYIKKVTDFTVEDLMTKIYSIKDAQKTGTDIRDVAATTEDENGNKIPTKWLKLTADLLTEDLRQKAKPMALLNATYTEGYKQSVVIVPENCSFLKQEIQNRVGGGETQVLSSSEEEKIIWYTLHYGIAPYMLDWTILAEQHYEKRMATSPVGLHLDEAGEENWRILPDLCPRTLWGKRNGYQGNDRERDIEDTIDSILEDLKEKGFVKKDDTDPDNKYPWYIYLPKKVDNLDINGLLGNLDEREEYELDDCINNGSMFDKIQVRFSHQETGSADDWKMAKMNVRKQILLMNRIKNVAPMLNDFKGALERHNEIARSLGIGKKRTSRFIDLLVLENKSDDSGKKYLNYDSRRKYWYISIPDENIDIKDEDNRLERKIQQESKEFYAREFIISIPEKMYSKIDRFVQKVLDDFTDDEYDEFESKKKDLKYQVKDIISGDAGAEFEFESDEFIEEFNDIEKGLADRVIDFYKDLLKQL